jgi:hypothetical protein
VPAEQVEASAIKKKKKERKFNIEIIKITKKRNSRVPMYLSRFV